MKKFISSLSLITIAAGGWASVLTPQQAFDRLAGVKAYNLSISTERHRPDLIATCSVDNQPAVYIFADYDNGNGYVILSADDEVAPLLGYGDSSGFDASGINSAMQWWLDEYASQIKWLRDNHGHSKQLRSAAKSDKIAIEPMVTTRWDQNDPYNYMCPVYDSYMQFKCPTGCGATAMAQVLNYHRYSTTSFDWDNMLDSYDGAYTNTERNAVAKLMYECGSASNTVYNSYGSAASTDNIMKGLVSLGYDKYVANTYMNNYSVMGWNNMIYDQLQNYGPVIISGFYGRTGHAFVCDGYDGNGFFHINWGWGGKSDGYFRLTAMTPEEQGTGGSTGGYNSNVSAIVNICRPNSDAIPPYILSTGKLWPKVNEIALGEEFTINNYIQNRNSGYFDGAIGYKLVSESTSEVSYHTIKDRIGIGSNSYGNFKAVISPDVAEGDYRMYLVWKAYDTEVWNDILVTNYYLPYMKLKIDGGMAYFISASGVDLSVDVESFETPFFIDSEFRLKANISNNGECDYNQIIYALLFGEDGTTKYAYGDNSKHLLLAGESSDFDYISKFSKYRGKTISPGKYYLAFTDYYDTIISQMYPIEIQAKPDTGNSQIEVLPENTSFIGNPDNADRENLNFSVSLKANGGYFIGKIWAKFFEDGLTYSDLTLYSNTLYVPQDETQTIHMSGSIPQLEVGKNYTVELHSSKGKLTDTIATLHIGDNTTTIENVGQSSNVIVSCTLYTLTGIRVDENNASPGIYIEHIVYDDGKVLCRKHILR